MIPKRPALGRGLTSLMSQMAPEDASQREVPVGSLVPNRHQPRLYFTQSVLHNPTSSNLSPAKAFRVLQLAEKHAA